ncbi:MAG: hypothetical protein OXH75_02260 [Acidobacteria bacterium]|nr:hypothetical protein [Acidobacteriota bacterium]
MTPTKTVRLSAIKKMLAKCAPGWTIRLATHSRVIQFKGKTYHLPKDDPMPSFQVRKLVSQLEIDAACAKKHFPNVQFRRGRRVSPARRR